MDKDEFELWLKKLDLTQKELADLCGLTQAGVVKWKRTGKFPKWLDGWLAGREAIAQLDTLRNVFKKSS
jgi:transcriptional regulator with XRE-family HTH domain